MHQIPSHRIIIHFKTARLPRAGGVIFGLKKDFSACQAIKFSSLAQFQIIKRLFKVT